MREQMGGGWFLVKRDSWWFQVTVLGVLQPRVWEYSTSQRRVLRQRPRTIVRHQRPLEVGERLPAPPCDLLVKSKLHVPYVEANLSRALLLHHRSQPKRLLKALHMQTGQTAISTREWAAEGGQQHLPRGFSDSPLRTVS